MAKLIPPTIDPEIKSNAEIKVFNWFRDLKRDSFCFIHSLGIANHRTNIFGEIDFVLICREGMLCIEIKGGRVARKDGVWNFTNRFGDVNSKHKGPFEQVQGNMNSLRDYFNRKLNKQDPIVKCQYACCVMMPDCIFEDRGPDIVPEILFDGNKSENDLDKFLAASFGYWRNQCKTRHGFEGGQLSDDDISRAVSLLRGDFQYIPSLAMELNRTDQELLLLTDEQYDILENLEENPRILVHGPAGTGKTLLAVEQCRRESTRGRKILLLCYNRLISEYISKALYADTNLITVSTIGSLLVNYTQVDVPDEADDYFYKEILPEYFLNSLPENGWGEAQMFDQLILDEGQDLINTNYLMCLDTILKGGIENGSWTIYYDPNQNIFNNDQEFSSTLIQLKARSVSYGLSVNCRNTRQIGQANILISNLGQIKTMKVSGQEACYESYSDLDSGRKIVTQIIRNLLAQGVSRSDIVILSPYRLDNTNACMSSGNLPSDIGLLYNNPSIESLIKKESKFIKYYTIQSFKGLDSKVVILCDIDEFELLNRRLLNYVGVSRARSLLYMLYRKSAEESRQRMLINGYKLLK